jgi:hypothetical protein
MFDNLRQQSMEESSGPEELGNDSLGSNMGLQGGLGLINTLTPPQRFILALMLFLNVTVLGCAALLVFGRIALF